MCLGASNVSFGLPQRHVLNAAFLPMAMAAGLTSAIMSTAAVCVESVRAADLLLGGDPWGASWIAAHRARQARGGARPRRERARQRSARGGAAPADGARRVRLRFTPDGAEVRVPAGTTIFDAASWNGIAIDSTCGGYGTCKKCRVRVIWARRRSPGRSPRVHGRPAARRLAPGLPRQRARGPDDRGAAAADAAQGSARRGRASRDPAPGGAEASPRARGGDDGGPALGPAACARRNRRPRVARNARGPARARHGPTGRAFRRHRRYLWRRAERPRAGRHDHAAPRDRVRPRHDHGRGDAARPRHRHPARRALDAQPTAALRR